MSGDNDDGAKKAAALGKLHRPRFSSKKEAAVEKEIPDFIQIVSTLVDENIYEPHFQSTADTFSRNLSETMTNTKTFKKIDDNLRFTKVNSLIAAIFLFLQCLRYFALASPIYALLYGFISVDLLRVSHNCYLKNYCCIALKRLGADGDPKKLGAAFFQWAQSAVGVKNSEDPFAKLSEKIIYEVIFNKCISISLYHKVQNAISK
mmetsp:Transcript_15362/g.14732  ORF Transcript_15362/g.14732 Transcript_15362/m.14732 type:complete len:205 (-) Transcript_15362:92-706(-)